MHHRIAQDLLALGLRPGGVVLVHSSLKSLGHVEGGPQSVIEGLLLALGPAGTLLLPALSYASVGPAQPLFDVRHTPCCVGAIPEYFRRRAGVRRSLHPTHSVCGLGPRAAEMLNEHHLDDTPCGAHSPFRRLRDAGGQILMLGCGLMPNTSMHGVEELALPPYLFGPVVHYRLIRADGTEIAYACRSHDFRGFRQRYDRLAEVLDGRSLRVGGVLKGTAHLIEAVPMWREALAAIRGNPLYFVEG